MSNSRVMSERFRERAILRRAVAFIYVAVMLVYLTWRLTIFSPVSLGLSLVYYLAEVLGFVLGLVIIFCSWDYRHRTPRAAPPGASVDIFVPSYQESIEIVRWTLIAAKEISYPHQTFLLDDGNRAAMKALADELGVRYLARAENVNAKAGNLNHGLAHSTADFVMVFDADHVAMPHALDVMLGFFDDPEVAMVQSPQDYYNIDAFQYFSTKRGGLWHDQTFFYNISEPCRDAFNGASCVGTGVVYRRSAIDAIGGIPTDTITEDMQTSLKLHKAGQHVVFLNEPVAYGIAAADLREFYTTRHRWAHGNLHALRIEKILTCPGLSLGQRLSYLTLGLIYLEGWQQLLLFCVPVVSLFAGLAPFQITVFNVFVVLFFPIVTTMLLQELGCGFSRAWVNEIFSAARFPLHIVSWLALFGRKKIAFRPSNKIMRGTFDWTLLLPQFAVLAASLGALVLGVINLSLNFKVGPLADAFLSISAGQFGRVDWNAPLDQGYTLELVTVSGFWALFNITKIGFLIRKAIVDQRRQAQDYLFSVRQPLRLATASGDVDGRAERISWTQVSGCIYGEPVLRMGQRVSCQLHLPSGSIDVEMVITSLTRAGAFMGEWVWRDAAPRDCLVRALLSVDWHREFLHRDARFTTPFEAIGRVLTWRRPFPKASVEWEPVLYRGGANDEDQFAVGSLAPNGASELIAFQPLPMGSLIDARFYRRGGIERHVLTVGEQQASRSLGSQGLDGAVAWRYCAKIERSERLTASQVTAIAAE
jgi:cellulose synthase (UDP-forming)